MSRALIFGFAMLAASCIALVPAPPARSVWESESAVGSSSVSPQGLESDGVRLIVGFESGDTHLDFDELADVIDESMGSSLRVVSGLASGLVLGIEQPVDRVELGDFMARAESIAGIEFVELDAPRWIADSPDDQQYPSQWSLTSLYGPDPAVGTSIEEAWATTPGSSDVVVAIIDTGMLPHPDITARLVPGADLITSPSISNDGDGRDGDNTDTGDTCGGVPSSWHGLHVAGTIGATTNNGLGIAGVDQRARVLPVRAIGACGGWASDVADAIRWAAGLPVPGLPPNPTPANVLNLSLGGPGACSLIEQSAIDAAVGAGATIVAAIGNGAADLDASPFSPASCNNVIAVAATTRFGDRADYSNFGSVVDIAAPGGLKLTSDSEGIVSLSNTGTAGPDLSPAGWTYTSKQGTSMAAPHVSGVISLMLAANPTLSPAQIEQILKQTARPFSPSARGANLTCSSDPSALYHCGAGLLDAGAAVRAADTLLVAPSAPGAVNVQARTGRATVTWTKPSDGAATATGYTVTASPGGRSCTWSSGPLTCVVDGLDAGRQYTVSVVGQNRKGVSPPSLSAPFTWWPTFNSVVASRLFDTRLGAAGGLVDVGVGRVVPGSSLSVGLLGVGGVPSSGVGGLSLNVTVTGALEPGFLSVFGCGGAVPWVSSVNFGVGGAVANAVVVPPGVGGRVCFDASTPVHVIADINGWFAADR